MKKGQINVDKELEEAKKFLKSMVKEYKTFGDLDNPEFEDTEKIYKAIETVLTALENSIPKQLIEKKKKEIELPLVIVGGRRNGKTLEYGKRLGKLELIQELLEGK